jgi:hypothetical protein
MTDHPIALLLALGAAIVTAVAAAIATRLQLLPDVIDVSIVPTAAGLGGLVFASYGAARRFGPDRLGRITLFGNLFGAALALFGLLVAVMLDVLS